MMGPSEKEPVKIFRDFNDPMEFDSQGRLYLGYPMVDWELKPIEPKNGMVALVGEEDMMPPAPYRCVIEKQWGIWRARPTDPAVVEDWRDALSISTETLYLRLKQRAEKVKRDLDDSTRKEVERIHATRGGTP